MSFTAKKINIQDRLVGEPAIECAEPKKIEKIV
jgi:hypothetical protein